ncbi:hypothetical protein DFS34DRAFT_113995 [Phlyctochytrium arcticum]|nr:hypothetical protein DFS34DRAFT_113995 [Phlyctochytrium arcticum]
MPLRVRRMYKRTSRGLWNSCWKKGRERSQALCAAENGPVQDQSFPRELCDNGSDRDGGGNTGPRDSVSPLGPVDNPTGRARTPCAGRVKRDIARKFRLLAIERGAIYTVLDSYVDSNVPPQRETIKSGADDFKLQPDVEELIESLSDAALKSNVALKNNVELFVFVLPGRKIRLPPVEIVEEGHGVGLERSERDLGCLY